MTKKLNYWAECLKFYSCDSEMKGCQSIEVKRLNFCIGKNNVGRSRFMRSLFLDKKYKIKDFFLFILNITRV